MGAEAQGEVCLTAGAGVAFCNTGLCRVQVSAAPQKGKIMGYQYVSKDELYADIADYERGLAYRLAKEADAYRTEDGVANRNTQQKGTQQ